MNLAEEHMTMMVKKREKENSPGRIIWSKTGPDNPPLANFSQIFPKHVKCVDRLGKSLDYTTSPKERPTGTTKTPRSKQINLTRTSPLGLEDTKFTLIHWRNCLEELVPEEKESTGLGDQPDQTAGEAPVSRRRSRRQRWRERGSEVEELPKWAVHPDAPLLYGQTAGPDYPAQTWTEYSGPRIIRPKSGPDNPAWNFLAKEICGEKGLVCKKRMFWDEMGLG
jgi:hypothetical protein